MKFAFFGYDFAVDTLETLLSKGYELTHVFSFEPESPFLIHDRLQQLAARVGAKFTTEPVTLEGLETAQEVGVDCFLCMGYPYKIPVLSDVYMLNVHPTLLPKGAGMMPLPYVLEQPEIFGITVHKLTEKFDAGDVVFQRKLAANVRKNSGNLTENNGTDIGLDDVHTLAAKFALAAQDTLPEVFMNLPKLWDAATPQNLDDQQWLPPITADMNTLNFSQPIAEIDAKLRAFGNYGVQAQVGDVQVLVFQARVWAEAHTHASGKIMAHLAQEIVVTARDGYVCLVRYQVLSDALHG